MNPQPLRHALPFLAHDREKDTRIMRLFWMSEEQAAHFAAIVDRCTRDECEDPAKLAEAITLRLLQGANVLSKAPWLIERGRQLFPVLTDRDVEALPRSGAPAGRVRVLLFTVERENDAAQFTVKFEMNRQQANAYNIALHDLQHDAGLARDDAWVALNGVVGRLLQGATLTETATKAITSMAAHFSPVNVSLLPLATENDVRRWAFTA